MTWLVLLTGCSPGKTGVSSSANLPSVASLDPSHFDAEVIPDTRPRYTDADGYLRLLPPTAPPLTGTMPAELAHLDKHIVELLKEHDVPGCAVAIAKDGKLLVSRGYGWSNIQRNEPVKPSSLFRLASVSKTITAVAAFKLISEKRLKIEDCAFKLLNYPRLPAEHPPDPRLNQITVQQLLQCTGGWDRAKSGDPLFSPFVQQAAIAISPSLRADPEIIIRYWINSRPLDFEPGARFAYSNLGYAVLGRLISKVSGEAYETYVANHLLKPMGIRSMQLGRTLVAAPEEVTYYPFPGQNKGRGVFPNYASDVPLPYGGDFSLEAMQADSGWIASAPAMVKFASSCFGKRDSQAALPAELIAKMTERPALPEWKGAAEYFGCGWEIRSAPHNMTMITKRGSLAGCMSYLAHRSDGTTVCWLSNSRPNSDSAFEKHLSEEIWAAVDSWKPASQVDLFQAVD